MPKTETSHSSRPPISSEQTGKPSEQNFATRTATPPEGTNEKTLECPLCVEVFKEFSQLKWHLLSMHPRRPMIMELITERYGSSKSDAGAAQSVTSDSEHAQEEPSTCCTQTAEKLQPGVVENVAEKVDFEVPKVPPKLRHKATAVQQVKKDKSGTSSKESGEISAKHESVSKMSPTKESSMWAAYLPFCLNGSVSSEPQSGGHH